MPWKGRIRFLLRQIKQQLFDRQKETLDIFLQRGAISQAQYDKSLGDLIIKMGLVMPDKEE